MKKSNYISKYDYINYYTNPKNTWFFTDEEIISGIQLEIIKYQKNNKIIDNDFNNETDVDDFESEKDCYSIYKELLEENSSLQDDNPLVVEGKIIDELAKEFIKKEFLISNSIDLDKDFKYKDVEEKAKITEKLLKKNDNIILFQSVFIYKNLITKPDAIIKKNNKIYLIETKATSTTKRYHFLDIFFQSKVLSNQKYLKKNKISYQLCIIKYEHLEKNKVSFILSEYCNLKKSVSINTECKNLKDENYELYLSAVQDIKLGKIDIESSKQIDITINDIIYYNEIKINELKSISQENFKARTILNNVSFIFEITNKFEEVINELWEYKINLNSYDYPSNFEPSIIEKNNDFRVSYYWPLLRELYILKGYEIYNYSGTILSIHNNVIEEYKPGMDVFNYIKNEHKRNLFLSNLEISMSKLETKKWLSDLKKHRVYFDFETINTCIRPMDNSTPFNQNVTQCSIIKCYEKDKKYICNNLIIDPKDMDSEWCKKIIDSIYDQRESSYIVYNKSFEKQRLNDMKNFINDEDYNIKINRIINNLFDLAVPFIIGKNSPMIFIKKLYGFYSIKKVLKFIESFDSKIFNTTECKKYTDLIIYNGKKCTDITTLRFFNKISDEEWKEYEKELKIYCENDVRAMIAVEKFIISLLKKDDIKNHFSS